MTSGELKMPWTTPVTDMQEFFARGGGDLVKEVTRHYVSWDEFRTLEGVAGLPAQEVWDLLRLMRRASGMEIPIPDIEGNRYWYHRTHELADSTALLQWRCSADSPLHRQLQETRNRSVLVQSRIDETVAAALLDGIDIPEEHAHDLLQNGRAPRNDNERYLLNTLRTIDDLVGLIDVPFSPDLFRHLRHLLIEGVDVRKIRLTRPRLGLMTTEYSARQAKEAASRQLDYFSAYMNHQTGDDRDNPIFRALLAPDLFRVYRPLPDSNSGVGRLAYRLYSLKQGLPVLGMLNLARAKIDWEDGLLSPAQVSIQRDTYVRTRSEDATDLTGYETLAVQLALVALRDLTDRLEELRESDQELRTLLQVDPTINHRQRSVLGRALRDPSAEFRISFHKNKHSVVYATARADLLDLADKGLLTMGKVGRAMVFTPPPGLREYIQNEYGSCRLNRTQQTP